MAELVFHDDTIITSVFQLLGNHENDISKSLSWVLKECPTVLKLLIQDKCGVSIDTNSVVISYQSFEEQEKKRTFTDIEITDYGNFAVIIEAKRGWVLPGADQLNTYSKKKSFLNNPAKLKRILTLSECSDEYAKKNLPFSITANGIPVEHISWSNLQNILKRAKTESNNRQKNLISEFSSYLWGLMSMRNSNSVFVVSLSWEQVAEGHSYVDVVKNGHYYCPVKWFKNPADLPTYIAFRYDSKLQSIHHIDSYIVTRNMHDRIIFMADEEWDQDHYIFDLGPAIIPSHTVKCGPSVRWANQVNADIDTLLTCDTITEAMELSKKRRG